MEPSADSTSIYIANRYIIYTYYTMRVDIYTHIYLGPARTSITVLLIGTFCGLGGPRPPIGEAARPSCGSEAEARMPVNGAAAVNGASAVNGDSAVNGADVKTPCAEARVLCGSWWNGRRRGDWGPSTCGRSSGLEASRKPSEKCGEVEAFRNGLEGSRTLRAKYGEAWTEEAVPSKRGVSFTPREG